VWYRVHSDRTKDSTRKILHELHVIRGRRSGIYDWVFFSYVDKSTERMDSYYVVTLSVVK
jgi:hypothetical protein